MKVQTVISGCAVTQLEGFRLLVSCCFHDLLCSFQKLESFYGLCCQIASHTQLQVKLSSSHVSFFAIFFPPPVSFLHGFQTSYIRVLFSFPVLKWFCFYSLIFFHTLYPQHATSPIRSKLHHLLLSAITPLTLTLDPLPTLTLPAPHFPHLLPQDLSRTVFANDVGVDLDLLDGLHRAVISVGVRVQTPERILHRLHCSSLVKPVHELRF